MSAAKKLRALEGAASGPQTYGPESLEWGEAAASIMNALPQIVALVEAAENIAHGERPADSPAWTTGKSWRIELARSALAALDEALK